jgi:hypothetical protein
MRFKCVIEKNICQKEPSLEPFILQSAKDSYFYSKQILGKPWPEAEPAILSSPKYIHLYAKNLIKKRWKKGEDAFLKLINSTKNRYWIREIQNSVILYIKHVIKDRWEEVESFIFESPHIGLYLSILKNEKDIEDVRRRLSCEAIADNPTAKKFFEWNPTHVVKIKGEKAYNVQLSEKPNPNYFLPAPAMEEWLTGTFNTSLEYSEGDNCWYWKRHHRSYNLQLYKFKGTVTPLTPKK